MLGVCGSRRGQVTWQQPTLVPGRGPSLISALQHVLVVSSALVVRPQVAAGPPARGNTFQTHVAPLCSTWHEEAGAHRPAGDAFLPGTGREPGARGRGLILPISQMGPITEALATYVTGLGEPGVEKGPKGAPGVLRPLT